MNVSKGKCKGTTKMANAIDKIPNSIAGDGSSFVAQLKKALSSLRSDVELIDEGDTSSYCQSVTNVTLTQRKQGNDNFIDVSWNKESVYGYKEAFVFFRPINTTHWQLSFVTEQTSGTIENVQVGTRYAVRVVPHNIDGGYDKEPREYFIDVVESMVAPSTPTQFFVNFDSGEGHWEWKYEGAYDFFELRTDTNVGETSEYLLARTNRKEVFKEPNILQGTAYLYVRNNFGVYSDPATTTFNISEEGKPPKPSISRGANGINIHMTPNERYGSYVVQVEELEYDTENNPFYLARTRGAMRCRYRWKNGTSVSEWSNWIIVNISELIDTEDLVDNCITADKISSGAVTTSKLFAGNIDLMGNLAIVGGAVTFNENGVTCVDDNGDAVRFGDNGMSFLDTNGNTYAGIGRFAMGIAKDGDRVNLVPPWSKPPAYVAILPIETQLMIANYASADTKLNCMATNISNTGFNVTCATTLASGSNGSVSQTQPLNDINRAYKTGTSGDVSSQRVALTIPYGASDISVVVSGNVGSNYYIEEYYNDGDLYSTRYTSTDIYSIRFDIVNNGQVVATYTSPKSHNVNHNETFHFSTSFTETITANVDYNYNTFLQATVIREHVRGLNGRTNEDGKAEAYFSYAYNAEGDVKLSQGTALFMAIETLSSGYTISR